VLDTKHGKILALMSDLCEFSATGYGAISEDGIVTKFQLVSIDALDVATPIF
jgi:hypothetical protein